VKIAIDFRIFGTKYGGLGRYNHEFLRHLIKIDSQNKYILIFKEDPGLDLPKNFQVEICDCHWYSFKEQFVLPYILYKIKPDLVHFTHFNVPILYNSPYVVTIHDLIMTKFPSQRASTHSRIFFRLKYWFYQQVIRHAIFNSESIIAVSKFTAQDIIKYFEFTDVESKKIQVIYEGVSQVEPSQKEAFNLPKNFFLYVGNAYPHKNLEFLINAFEMFFNKHPEYHLVLAGSKDYFYKRLESETKCPNIIFTGHITDDVLASYYKNARAYVFPSKYEGFGLPPLEAMAHSLPVLSSQASCLPEILGHSALYFDPDDQNDLFQKMEEIVANNLLRAELIKAGLKQIQKYSWSDMTKKILEVYKNY